MSAERRMALGCAFAGALLLGAAQAAGQEPGGLERLTVLFTSDLEGRFVEPACGGGAAPGFAHLVGAIDAVRWELAAAGRPPPLVIHGGGNLGPSAFARSLLSRGDDGSRRLAGWLARAGYDLVGLGEQDFLAPPARTGSFLRAGRAAGLVFGAANLDCPAPARGVCAALEPGAERPAWLERGGLRIAVFSVVRGDLAARAPGEPLAGVGVAEPLARAHEVAARARIEGADVVIALSQLDSLESAPRAAVALARALPEVDLVLASSLGGGGQARGVELVRFSDGGTPVVGCAPHGRALCRVEFELQRQGAGWRVSGMEAGAFDPAGATPDEAVLAELEEERQLYCSAFVPSAGQVRLAEPMDVEGLLAYLLEIMRHETLSELAFAHRGVLDARAGFPLAGVLCAEALFAALPRSQRLFTVELTGVELAALCRRQLEEQNVLRLSQLVSRGLQCDPSGATSVNGRPLDPAASYTAVTVEHLAQGGLGYFQAQAQAGRMRIVRPIPEDDPPTLAELALAFLAGPGFQGEAAQPIDLARNFPDLARAMRWTLGAGLNLNLTDTTISNGPGYAESQLARKEFVGLKLEARGLVDASSSLHAFSLDGLLRYARGYSQEAGWPESEDLVTLGLIYKLLALRDGLSAWYVPAPYAEAKLESELTRPEDDASTPAVDEGRAYHHLELTATLGLRFPLLSSLEAKLGFGVRDELLDRGARMVYGVDLGYRLTRTDLFGLLGSPVQLESELSAFFGDIGRTNTLKGTFSNRVYFAIVGPIFFNVSHDLFVYRFSTRGYGVASDLTVGLSYNARAAFQSF